MIHILTALSAEAKPLIEHYDLKPLPNTRLFDVYTNQQNTITVTVSGVGKSSCAAAIGYLNAINLNSTVNAWLNLGIAGHGHSEVGDAYLVNRVTDNDTGKSWYPCFIFDSPLPQQHCVTVSKVSTSYENYLFDMEASAFMELSTRLATTELTHIIKIVSDNDSQSLKKINKTLAQELIHKNIDAIDQIVQSLLIVVNELAEIQTSPKFYDEFLHSWHFSKTQSSDLLKQLTRWQLLRPDENPFQVFKQSLNSKTILLEMGNILDNTGLRYD